jgi:3-oxoacyl-[acyl-carrier protein] reductase
MKLLSNKTALVTGGTRGIGRAIVLHFAQHGADVAFTYAGSTNKALEVEAEVRALGVKCLSFQANAAETAKAVEVVESIVKEWGRLDIVVNNAGITRDNILLRMTEQQWDEVMDTNLKSLFNYTKAASKPMMSQRKGVFVNISSVVGIDGNPGQSNYAASKAGCIGFTKSIAQEMASRNIRANVVAPGFIATEMTDQIPEKELNAWLAQIPLKRAGTPQEVADLCVFLASDMSGYITGQVIPINGGMS